MNTAQTTLQAPHKRKLWYLLPIAILLIAGGAFLHFHRLHQADTSPPAERSPWALQTGEGGTRQPARQPPSRWP